MNIICSVLSVLICAHSCCGNLYVNQATKSLEYMGQKVFLSGVNIAWWNYANDFGMGRYNLVKSKFHSAIDEVANNGGNVIRTWVHIDGSASPKFDSNGYATGEDTTSLIADLGELLDYAKTKGVFVIPVLWNLAVAPNPMIALYTDMNKLNSYLTKVLKPLATGLSDKPALAAIEIVNEPMGSMKPGTSNTNPCFDTNILVGSGANWTNAGIDVYNILRFINLHTDAIKSVAPNIMVTVGESSERSTTNIASNCRNYYTNQCLIAAGGKPLGVLDFYEVHTYTWQGKYSAGSPFNKINSDYNLDKPFLVGEFASVCSEDKSPSDNYWRYYNAGYAGALSWQFNEGGDCSDTKTMADQGMAAIRSQTKNGKIKITI